MIETQEQRDRLQEILIELWYGLNPTTRDPIPIHVQRVFLKALGDLTVDEVQTAADKWMKTGKFFPKPAELRELVESDGMYELLTTERIIEKYGSGGYIA